MRDKFSAVFQWQIKRKSMSDCVLCFSPIVNHKDKNLVQGRGQFKVFEEISSLQFVVHCTSPYICKSCFAKLQKRRGLHDNLKKIDEDPFNDYSSKAFEAGLTVKKKFQESVDSKRILLDESVSCSPKSTTSPLTSTPAKIARPVTTVPISPVRPVILEGSDGEDRGKTVVEVKIQWPCNKNKVMSQLDHNHNLCEIQNSNSGILRKHD